MSFAHLSNLESQPTTSRSTGYADDPAFTSTTTRLSSTLFTLTSNITQLIRQLSLIGTPKDTEKIRDRVHRLITETRDGFKTVTAGVKSLQTKYPDEEISPAMKYAMQKLESQLGSALADFQAAQRLAAEKSRQYVIAARRAQNQEEGGTAELEEGGVVVPLVQQEFATQNLADQGEVEFQESLIQQREEEIRDIERGVTELNDIFKDLHVLVASQGDQIDHIDQNIGRVAQDHKAADQELRQAARYQKGARNRMCCLLLILAVILTVVLLAVFLG